MPKHPFEYHKPNDEQVERMTLIRLACKAAHDIIVQCAPVSAERTLAIRSLQQCSMWANLSIVLEEGTPVDENQSPGAGSTLRHMIDQGIFRKMPEPPPVDNEHVAPGCERFSEADIHAHATAHPAEAAPIEGEAAGDRPDAP